MKSEVDMKRKQSSGRGQMTTDEEVYWICATWAQVKG